MSLTVDLKRLFVGVDLRRASEGGFGFDLVIFQRGSFSGAIV